MVQNRGRLVTKDGLMKAVWPDTFVEEAKLTVIMSALRRALGESGEGRQYIETVPRRGYRFNAGVEELAGESDRLGQQAESFHALNEGIASTPRIAGIAQPVAGETHGSRTRHRHNRPSIGLDRDRACFP